MNRYAYVNNDPINFVDPSGLNLSSGGGWSCTGTWSAERQPDGTIVNFRITSSHCVIWGGGGRGGQSSALADKSAKERDASSCRRFADILAKIASEHTGTVREFVNKLWDRFANSGDEFGSEGFKDQFADYGGSANQARHYVGGLWAGVTFGWPVGEIGADSREIQPTEFDDIKPHVKFPVKPAPPLTRSQKADRALNRVSTFHGASLAWQGGLKPTDLADRIRREVCK